MKYRQWKKNYKKKYGANPPFELDKRKQRRYARKMARQINITLPTMMETLTKEIDGWMKSLKSALATMCESMAITLNDTAGRLRESTLIRKKHKNRYISRKKRESRYFLQQKTLWKCRSHRKHL